MTNAVAVIACLPGSALGSRPELLGQGRRLLRLAPLAVIGGVAGAVLLLVTPAGVFDRIVPFLVALAAVALLIQPRVAAKQGRHSGKSGRFLAHCGLLAVWVYDGYWGAGAGVMTLAVLMLTVETQLTQANAFKNVLLGVADIACSVVFVLYGPVRWTAVVPLALGFLAGSRVALRWHGGYPKTFSASWSHWPGSGSQCTCGSAPVSGSRWRDGEHAGATWSTMTPREKRQGAWLASAAHTSRQLERSTQPSSSRPIVQLAAVASRPPCGRRFAMASPA